MNTRTYDSNRPQEISCGLTCKKENPLRWGERRYYALDYYLKQNFGEKLYKISLNGGCSCPNRDGTCGTRGCIFCSEGGSGDFAASSSLSVADQLAYGKGLVRPKYNGHSYIAYFQAYTNTYAPISYLKELFTEAIAQPDIAALSIATRCDCLPPEVLDLLSELNCQKPVWIELGLQSIHNDTLRQIRSGFTYEQYLSAVDALKDRGLSVITHLILGLPGETKEMMLASVDAIAHLPVDGVKLQLLHVLKNTDLALLYEKAPFPVFSLEEYCDFVVTSIEHLPPEMVIHRLTGDGPRSLLIAPLWSTDKKRVLNTIYKRFRERDTWQGKLYQ